MLSNGMSMASTNFVDGGLPLRQRIKLDPFAVVDSLVMSASLPLLKFDRKRTKPGRFPTAGRCNRPAPYIQPGGRIRYLPPLPLSAPAGRHPPVRSATPVEAADDHAVSSAGGISTTTGPAVVS